MINNWDNLGPDARIWFYGTNRALTTAEENSISAMLEDFCANWAAHGAKLDCGYTILHHRFILLGVDEKSAAASGCSIDSSVHVFQQIDRQYQLDLFNRLRCYQIENEAVTDFMSHETKHRIAQNQLNENSLVVNTLTPTIGDLKSAFEIPLKETWLKQFLN
jgi:hypothetical protein